MGGTCRFWGVRVGFDRKTGKRLLMGGLDSYRWLLEVISFSLVPNLTDLEKFDFGVTCRFWWVRVGLDQKTGKRLLMGGLDSYRWLLEMISFSLVPNLTDLEKFDFGGYL